VGVCLGLDEFYEALRLMTRLAPDEEGMMRLMISFSQQCCKHCSDIMATIVIYSSNLHDRTINTFIGDHSDSVGIAFVDCLVFVGVAFVTLRSRCIISILIGTLALMRWAEYVLMFSCSRSIVCFIGFWR
jgi:hypothetical protein